MKIQKLWRNIMFVYWVADYFPGNNFAIILFEKLKKFYHKRIRYVCYASDTINEIMNKSILENITCKTIMLGVNPQFVKRVAKDKFTIMFVGLIKESQGLDFVFTFLRDNKEYSLKVLGVCEKKLYKKYTGIVKKYNISSQVYFPNRFFSDKELKEISKECQIGIAMYNPDPSNVTYYTDPGKVKAYTTLGLPVVMSNMPSIAPYIEKFSAGEIVDKNEHSLSNALKKIKKNYKNYSKGVEKFNKYFYFEDYYRERFVFLEEA